MIFEGPFQHQAVYDWTSAEEMHSLSHIQSCVNGFKSRRETGREQTT